MSHLLTHHIIAPCGGVIFRFVEKRIVYFYQGLRDVTVPASIYPYLGDAEPPNAGAIRVVTNLNAPENGITGYVVSGCDRIQ